MNSVFFLANQNKLVYPVKFVSFEEKGVESAFLFFFQGFTELLPIDLIKIFDENELEVCTVNILCKGDFFFFKYLITSQLGILVFSDP